MKHWIKISGFCLRADEIKGWNFLAECRKHGYIVTPYRKKSGFLFDRYFLVETKDSYDELKLDVNSMSSSLIRLRAKPKNIQESPATFDELLIIFAN